MAELKVQCPECQASLKLKDSSKLGKKIACPKCKHVFVAKSSAEDDDFLSDLPPEEEESGEEEDEAPRSRRGGSSKSSKKPPAKGKKKAAESDGPNVALLAGVGVLALLILGGVGLWASGLLGGKGSDTTVAVNQAPAPAMPQPAAPPAPAANPHRLDLTWLPSDAELFVRLRPAKLLSSALANDLGGADAPQLADFKKATGLSPGDIESFTLAVPKISETLGKGMMQAMSEKPDLAIGVVRLTKPLDLATVKIMDQAATAVTHGSKTYQKFPALPGDKEAFGLYSASPTVVVIGNETALKQAIDRGETVTPRPELDFIDADQDVVFAILPKDAKAVLQPLKFGAAMGGASIPESVEKAADNSFVGLCIGANLHQGFDLQVAVALKDANAATQVKTDVEKLVAAGKESFEEIKQSMPPNLGGNLGSLVSSVKLTNEGNVAKFSASLPKFDMGQAMMLTSIAGSMGRGGMDKEEEDAGPAEEVVSGVEATPQEGVPAGLKMGAEAEWGWGIDGPGPLQIKLSLKGPPAELTTEIGRMRIQKIETDPPLRLKEVPPSNHFGSNPRNSMRRYSRRGYESLGGGINELYIEAAFERPQQPVKSIKKLSGTFRLMIGKETREVTVKNVRALVKSGKPVVESGVRLVLEEDKEEKSESVLVSPAGPDSMQVVQATDGAGKKIEGVEVGPSFRDEFTQKVQAEKRALPDDLMLKITLITEPTAVEVPFVFENLPVPEPRELTPEEKVAPPWKLASNKDVPADLVVEGKTRWRPTFEKDDNGKPIPAELHLVLDLTGPMAERIKSYGFFKVDKITTDSDAKLTLKKVPTYMDDPAKKYLRPGTDSGGNRDPVGGIQLSFAFLNPGKPTKMLKAAEGSIKLQAAKETKVAIFDNILSRAGKNFSGKELRDAGLELKMGRDERQVMLKLVRGKMAAVESVRLLQAGGGEIPGLYTRMDEDDNTIYIHYGEQELPKDVKLEMTLNVGLQAVVVPFKFEELVVPPEPKKEE